jgi:hypothetical protein
MPTQVDRGNGAVHLPPAPAERIPDRLRRRWRSRGRHRALKFWVLFRGIPIFLLYAILFALNGFLIGWRKAYDVSLAITSPADTTHATMAWLLSLAGWLVAPGIAGAVAGYVITASIASRRGTPVERAFAEDRDG